jgi:hypothetical protein
LLNGSIWSPALPRAEIIALGLTISKSLGAPLYSAGHYVELYEKEGGRIFSRSLARTMLTMDSFTWKKYSSNGIEAMLDEYFADSRLGDAVSDVLTTSYEIVRRFPFFFKSRNARVWPDYDFRACDVARATSAAPAYFEPMKISSGTNSEYDTLIDRGCSPMTRPLAHSWKLAPHPPLQTTCSYRWAWSAHADLTDTTHEILGRCELAQPLLDIVFDGVSETVDYQLHQLMSQNTSANQNLLSLPGGARRPQLGVG